MDPRVVNGVLLMMSAVVGLCSAFVKDPVFGAQLMGGAAALAALALPRLGDVPKAKLPKVPTDG